MATPTIPRTPMIDDDGSGQVGTIINAAWKTELYNQIDAVVAAALASIPGGVPEAPINGVLHGRQDAAWAPVPAGGWPGGVAGNLPFPATQVPSGGANVLDDYEEGTFVPVDGSGAGLALTAQGNYVKVGQLVCATIGVLYPANANANVAFVTLGALPVGDGNVSGYGVAIAFNDLGYAVNAVIDAGTNKVNFRNSATNVQIKNSDLAGHTIRATATYRCNP